MPDTTGGLPYNQFYCSRMDAACYNAPVCYSETTETTDTECSEGFVLCTAVDDESNRVMYSKKDLDDIFRDDELPF